MALEVDAKSCSETLYCLISALDYPGVKVLQKSSGYLVINSAIAQCAVRSFPHASSGNPEALSA